MKTEIVATIIKLIQIGMDDWQDRRHSKVFPMTATLAEIESWGKQYGKSITIHDVQLSTLEK